MLHPELRYDLARHEHQARIDAAARKRELRAFRQGQRGSNRNLARAGDRSPDAGSSRDLTARMAWAGRRHTIVWNV